MPRAAAQLDGNTNYDDPFSINALNPHTTLGTVFHELLHNITGLTDVDIQKILGLAQSPATFNITQRILADCFGGA